MQKSFISVGNRKLEISFAGEPQSSAIIFHHGTPGASSTWDSWIQDVAARGGFAIAYSRPGYGLSERAKDRTVISNTDNIEAICKHFGITKIVSIGWSGGGPHCLADTTLPQSMGAISLAGVGEFGASDLNFLEGMGEENHVEFGAAIEGETAIENWMKANTPDLAKVTGDQIIEAFGGLIGDADKKALTPALGEDFAASFRQALEVSYFGWMDDDLAFVKPWGFDISKISKPVELWQGNDDFMVPHAHGKWLASKIPTSKLIFQDGEGHISLGENSRGLILDSAFRMLG